MRPTVTYSLPCLLLVLGTGLQAPAVAESKPFSETALQAQVWLDRAGFSPGEIDGRWGRSSGAALAAYLAARGQPGDGSLDATALGVLTPADNAPALAVYTIVDVDTAGPFIERLPADLNAQALLPHLGFTTALEGLAEQFHASPALLASVNPGAAFVAGETIKVPNLPAAAAASDDSPGPQEPRIVVSRASSALWVLGPDNAVLFYAPVSAGTSRDPLPLGEWKVKGVSREPVFHYDPSLFWDAKTGSTKAVLPAGPNNPVGSVWIDLDKEQYGIHGTASPEKIRYAQSHGCVRMTNWDALRVAAMVRPGTAVTFEP